MSRERIIECTRDLFSKIKHSIFPSKELTEQEKLIIEKISKMLSDTSTITVMVPGDRYYLINDPAGKLIKVSQTETVISDKGFFLNKNYTLQFQESLVKLIRDHVCKYADTVEARITSEEISQLQEMVLRR